MGERWGGVGRQLGRIQPKRVVSPTSLHLLVVGQISVCWLFSSCTLIFTVSNILLVARVEEYCNSLVQDLFFLRAKVVFFFQPSPQFSEFFKLLFWYIYWQVTWTVCFFSRGMERLNLIDIFFFQKVELSVISLVEGMKNCVDCAPPPKRNNTMLDVLDLLVFYFFVFSFLFPWCFMTIIIRLTFFSPRRGFIFLPPLPNKPAALGPGGGPTTGSGGRGPSRSRDPERCGGPCSGSCSPFFDFFMDSVFFNHWDVIF